MTKFVEKVKKIVPRLANPASGVKATSVRDDVGVLDPGADVNAKATSVCDDIGEDDAAADDNANVYAAIDVEHMDFDETPKVCLKKDVKVSTACSSAADEVSKIKHLKVPRNGRNLSGNVWFPCVMDVSKEDTAYRRLDFIGKRVCSIPNTAYPA
ncbi:hypothetical protein Tco_0670704 [Tanacetum coccineum]